MKRGIIFLKLCSLVLAFAVVLNVMLAMLYANEYIDGFPGVSVFNAFFSLNRYRSDSAPDNLYYGEYNDGGYVDYSDALSPGGIDYNYNGIESSDVPYKEGSGVIENEKIDTIYINWAYGDINIIATDDTAISIKESLTPKEFNGNFIRYRTDGSELEIFMDYGPVDKNLTLKLPKKSLTGNDYKITVTSSNSDVSLRDLTIGSFGSFISEGDVTVNGCIIGEMDSSTVTGDYYINSCVSELTASVKGSGSVDIKSQKPPKNVNVSVFSGEITVRVPEDIPGFVVKENRIEEGDSVETRSIGFNSDFEYEERSDSLFAYGDESLFINASIYSGTVSVLEIQ